MSLAIFDLDNTLIGGDSDYLWGEFLVQQGLVDAEFYQKENQRYYQDYKKGQLDIHAFLRFSLAPLAKTPLPQLLQLRELFIDSRIQPIMLPKARELVEWHRDQQHTLLIITATNRFVTEPIAQLFNIDNLLASEPEMIDGKITGEVHGIPCYQHGKIQRLGQWLNKEWLNKERLSEQVLGEQQLGADMQLDKQRLSAAVGESWFYSDSHNDLPLLELVQHPIAVDADPQLTQQAQANNWQHISLR